MRSIRVSCPPVVAIALLFTLVLALASGAARAEHCSSKIFVHSYVAGAIAPPVSALCLLDDGHSAPVDYRLINPGATSILVQYLGDLTLPEITATLKGLGFDTTVSMKRTLEPATGTYFYASPTMQIPGGATASGCVLIDVLLEPEDVEPFESTAYHTAAARCPDFP